MDSVSVSALVSLGFTATEANVYCTMVPEEKMNGYQIAKSLNISRSSVYAALENMVNKGAILSIPGNKNEYTVVKPDELVDKILSNYEKNAKIAKSSLEQLSLKNKSSNLFLNIQGLTNIRDNVLQMIRCAQKEILISSSMDLKPFVEELSFAIQHGVRVIVFSMIKLELYGLNVEFYGGQFPAENCQEIRFSLVVDNKSCLICSNDKEEFYTLKQLMDRSAGTFLSSEDKDFLGMRSSNRLMVNIIQEHFHFDVYLFKLRLKNNGKRIITPDIQIGSLMECGN
ncbi:MAG: TrmB family transcriptional regulator [Treponema sp.]|nr:TrmB family transcriptional regulator [Treponema sp.]